MHQQCTVVMHLARLSSNANIEAKISGGLDLALVFLTMVTNIPFNSPAQKDEGKRIKDKFLERIRAKG
jgi:hypothetical protein